MALTNNEALLLAISQQLDLLYANIQAGGGDYVTGVTASSPLISSGGATPNMSFEPQTDGTYNISYVGGVPALNPVPNRPIFIYENSTIADFQPGNTYYYVGNSPITYDYDLEPYPSPTPPSGFDLINLSVHNVTVNSDLGNSTYVLTPNQRLRDIQIVDNGNWVATPAEYFDNIYNLQSVSDRGADTTNAIIVRNNPNNYRTRYSIVGQQVQYDVGDRDVHYSYNQIQVTKPSNLASFTINFPNIDSNTPLSNTIVNFRPNVGGTVAFLSDLTTTAPTLQEVTDNGNSTTNAIVFNAINKLNTFNADGVTVFNTGSNEIGALRQDRLYFNFGLGDISLRPNTGSTGPANINLPIGSGTLALTSDIANIYNVDGTITSNRIVSSSGANLTFNIDGNIVFNALGNDLIIEGSTGVFIGGLNTGVVNLFYPNSVLAALSINTDGVVYQDLGNNSIRLQGFGEADINDSTGVNYSGLKFNSLVPKKYVDDSELTTDREQVHTTGNAITVFNNRSILYVNPASTLATLTITLPSTPVNGQEVKISFGGTLTAGTVVTSLSIIGNVGQTILGSSSITSASAGDGYVFKYQSSSNLWRIF